MNQYLTRIATTAITLALTFGAFTAPAFAAELTISGNGADSHNTIKVRNSCTTTVNQSNSTDVNVSANVTQNTGNNTANSNTGGDVSITTGDTTSSINVSVGGSSNDATTPSCCDCLNTSSASATIDGNGASSTNKVDQKNTVNQTVKQHNKLKVKVKAKVKSKTGNNNANSNTNGTVDIGTGNTSADLNVAVDAPSNTL